MDFRVAGFWRLLLFSALLNCLAQAVHETGHWSVYQAYRRGPVWGFTSLVQVWEEPPLHPDEWLETTSQAGVRGWLRLRSLPQSPTEEFIAVSAGPVASLVGVVLGLALFRWCREPVLKQISLMFALTGSFVMSIYYLRSGFRASGDESQMAEILNLPKSAIEIPFALAFLFCLFITLRALKGWRTILKWLAALVLGSIPTGLLMMKADAVVRSQIEFGNPLFRSMFGFSLPVLLVNVIIVAGLFVFGVAARCEEMTFDR